MNAPRRASRATRRTDRPFERARLLSSSSPPRARLLASSPPRASTSPPHPAVGRSRGRSVAAVGRTRAETVGAYAWVVTRGEGGGTHTRVYSGDGMDVDKRMRDVARRMMLVMLVMEDSGTEYGCSRRSEGGCARDASDGDGDAVGRRRRRRRERERDARARETGDGRRRRRARKG